MSLTYALVVTGSAYGSQAARSAYLFAEALIAQQHKLEVVFFYQDGVSNASSLLVPANDEFDLTHAWQSLASKHGVKLEICIAAALRRGIVGEDEAQLHKLKASNLAAGFSQVGLGSLSERLLTADRVVQF